MIDIAEKILAYMNAFFASSSSSCFCKFNSCYNLDKMLYHIQSTQMIQYKKIFLKETKKKFHSQNKKCWANPTTPQKET